MSIPCESKPDIVELQKAISTMSNNGINLESAIIRMATAQEKQTAEMREMTQTITLHMVDNREFRLNLERGKEERDILFTTTRKLVEGDTHLTALIHDQQLRLAELGSSCDTRWDAIEILPERLQKIELSHNKLMGGIVVIPGVFTALSFFVVLYSTFGGK